MEDDNYHFFDGKLVHRATDEWGNILVLDYHNHRVMTFDSVYEQSRMDKEQPCVPVHEYTKAMLLVLAFIEPESAMLLGLGAGSLLRAVHHLYPDVRIDAVELREQVVIIAKQLFGLPKSDQVSVTVADAEPYLESQPYDSTDIIFADIYKAYDMDPLQKQVHFLQQSHRVLSDRGWLVMNFHEMPNANSSFMLRLNELFPEVLVCIVPKGNYIIYAGKIACDKPFSHYLKNILPLQIAMNTSFDDVYRRLNRLGETNLLKRANKKYKDKKNHFTDDDYPPVEW